MLRDYTVLNLASVGPAARAAQTLADFGATVIQVRAPAGAGGKQIEPAYHAYSAGRGTRQLRLDLKSGHGREVLLELASRSDVLLESFRPGVTARLKLGYADLNRVNPRLVYCSTTGYGQRGPYADWAGHDINYLGLAGLLDCSGRGGDGCPALPGATVADSAGGGMHACMSIMAALLERGRTGRGRYLDVAIVDGVLAMMSLHVDKYLATAAETTAGSDLLTGRYAWYGVYRTRDDRFVSVGAIEPKFYRNLCRLLDLEAFADAQYQDQRQPELRAALKSCFLGRDRDAWVTLLAPQDTCVAPVLSVAEVTRDPHLRVRQTFTAVEHPVEGRFLQLAPLFAGLQRPDDIEVDPTAGDSRGVLEDFGYSAGAIRRLMADKVVE